MKKKFIAIVIAFLLIFSVVFSGCSKKQSLKELHESIIEEANENKGYSKSVVKFFDKKTNSLFFDGRVA